MAKLKKNQMAQFLFPLVDKTDGFSLESGVTSNITVKFYGVNHNTSAAMTSGTVSKTASVVHSGIFRQTVKAAETNYDHIHDRLTHASAADQLITFDTVDNDDSDLYSAILLAQSAASDAHSAAAQANSRVLLNQSRISDIASFLVVMSGVQSDIYSALSDFQSDFGSRVPKRVATDSQLSDLHSDLLSYLVGMSGMLSDVRSGVSDAHSDLASKIGAMTVSVSASDISDIASAIWANTIGARVDSRILLNQSRISDIASYLVAMSGVESDIYSLLSDFESNLTSRVPKAVATNSQLSDLHSDLRSYLMGLSATVSDIYSAVSDAHSDLASKIGGITASVSASDISDIVSAVWAHTVGTRVDSRILVNQSRVSDIYSLLSDVQSDFQSRVPKRVATDSQISDVQSDLASKIGAIAASVSASDISDIASAVWANTIGARVDSRVLLNLSRISDVYSLLSDVGSDVIVMSGVLSDTYSALVALSDAVSNAYSAAAQANSRALVLTSDTSNIYSLLSDVSSDIGVMSGIQSDLYSLLTTVSTGVTDVSSVGSNIYSMLSDLMSDFQSRVPGRLTPAASALAELATDPGANPTLAQAVMTVFMWLHNNGKTTSSKRFLRNFAGTTVLSATIADNGSYVQGRLG